MQRQQPILASTPSQGSLQMAQGSTPGGQQVKQKFFMGQPSNPSGLNKAIEDKMTAESSS